MLDGNVLLRQKRDEVPEGTLSCPDRNLAVFHHYRHYEGLRLLPSVCDSKLIQQTLIMDSLFLLQFACLIFMLVNAFIVAVSHLHVRWESRRYERSRWMIVAAMVGLAMQYAVQMVFGFRAMHDNLGAVVNILIIPLVSRLSPWESTT